AAAPVSVPAGGRGFDQNGDHAIGASEGFDATAPQTIFSDVGGRRQTVADFMQLVRVIETGVDSDGDGSRDLDPSRIYYTGLSLGGQEGAVFLAVEPDVRAGVLTSAGGPQIDNRRLGNMRPALGTLLAERTPSLVNSPGVVQIGGLAVGPPQFNENMPLRDGLPLAVRLADGTDQVIQSPVINTVAGASAIQDVFDHSTWVYQSGAEVAYA